MPVADPAATVLLLREAEPFEVLMVARNSRGAFGSIEVFPGGAVEEADVPAGRSVEDDLSHRYAALRELAEESGIILTGDGARSAPGHKGRDFYRWLDEEGVALATDSLVLVSRWVTPEFAPRRFDTIFYLATCDVVPEVVIDADELVGYRWTTPADAIDRSERGESALILPTLAHLRWLARRSSIEDALGSARGAGGRSLVTPRVEEDGSMLPVHMPAEQV